MGRFYIFSHLNLFCLKRWNFKAAPRCASSKATRRRLANTKGKRRFKREMSLSSCSLFSLYLLIFLSKFIIWHLKQCSHEAQSGGHSGTKEVNMQRIHVRTSYTGTHAEPHVLTHGAPFPKCSHGHSAQSPFYAQSVVLRSWVIVLGNVICQNILWHCRSTS